MIMTMSTTLLKLYVVHGHIHNLAQFHCYHRHIVGVGVQLENRGTTIRNTTTVYNALPVPSSSVC